VLAIVVPINARAAERRDKTEVFRFLGTSVEGDVLGARALDEPIEIATMAHAKEEAFVVFMMLGYFRNETR